MEYIFAGINFLGSLCSIWALILIFRNKLINAIIKFSLAINTVLLFVIGLLLLVYYSEVNAKIRAESFYENYSTTSFENDFPDKKILVVISDGLVILEDLKFKEKYPVLYNSIIEDYKRASSQEFNKQDYMALAHKM